jgi:hypothetical protein
MIQRYCFKVVQGEALCRVNAKVAIIIIIIIIIYWLALISAIWHAEIGKIVVPGQPGQKSS